MKFLSVTVLGLIMGSSIAVAGSAKLSQAECDSLWSQANPSGSATITEAQAQPYVSNFKAANPDNDGTLDAKEFRAACAKGLVKSSASSGGGTGASGSSSSGAAGAKE